MEESFYHKVLSIEILQVDVSDLDDNCFSGHPHQRKVRPVTSASSSGLSRRTE